ncbi:MAG: VWA domain-containing protein [Anaerolineaceae bacterium]|nr:MAG: VWA domain-containing protein [Anaerolineaceae bacterium]
MITEELRFAHPILLLLAIVPVLPYLWQKWLKPERASLRFSDVRLLDFGGGHGWRVRLGSLPDVLRLIAWILLVVALARPQSGSSMDVLRGQGIDIVIAMDISSSMAALDFEPRNRLDAAKDVIRDFIEGREFDRIGLVAFARNAYHQAPLTLDYPVVLRLLEDMRLISELGAGAAGLDGTAIGLGIASAVNMLRDSDAPSRVIILLTDGVNNAGLDPLIAAEIAQTLGIRVYTVGMGRVDGEIPVPLQSGDVIMMESDLDEPTLQRVAQIADGRYFQAEDTAELQAVYAEINRLERSNVERQIFVRWQDQAAIFILLALMLLTAEIILKETLFQTVP